MPYLIETTGNDSRSVSKEFVPEITPRQKVFIDGMSPRPPDVSAELPTGLRVGKPRKGATPHILGWSLGPWIVSPRVKEIIDELEPGLHASVPITLIAEKTGEPFDTYHLLLATPIVDALDSGNSDTNRAGGLARTGRIGLKRKTISDRHLWKLPLPFTQTYFCSDELRARLQREGLDGWRMDRKCLVTE
ncbi:imm11 family protein [Hyphomicrobium sulfonivorans]|uniref:imm11 family protein n=1 Tax=Hyphomicrobium sulfonivorans TaxID=121290 RepID=UPI00156F5E68|nr:DUF1629 domain-containing protein [Hyphomicrobium sulfonivorans]MBI1649709.1 hypothetical protein [Hyphomicrobium sulfonivorans]NSL71624.1 hypothetical protein [Hyphomicrobium sulfonivorans]